jgi:hypothetical protein
MNELNDSVIYLEEPLVSVMEEDFNKALDKLRDEYSTLPISTIQTILNLANNV